MTKLRFFSLTTDDRFAAKWIRGDLAGLREMLREAVYMRDGSTILPPRGFTADDVRELRTILDAFACERYGDCSPSSLARIKEYFEAEIAMCESLIESAA